MMEKITVEGRGCVHVVPDVTRLDIKVKGLFKNYKEAYERAQQNSSMSLERHARRISNNSSSLT